MQHNKKYVFSFIFFLAWFLTVLYVTPDFNHLKVFLITGSYCYVGIVIAISVYIKSLYGSLQTVTKEQKIRTQFKFEYSINLLAILAACTIVEIVYCCLHGFAVNSFLHGLVCLASLFPTIYFIAAVVLHQKCKVLVKKVQAQLDAEVDERVLKYFKSFWKSLIVLALSLDVCSVVVCFAKGFSVMLVLGLFLMISFFSIFLSSYEESIRKVLYQAEGVTKNFHLDILDSVQNASGLFYHSFMLISLTMILAFINESGIVVPTGTPNLSTCGILLFAGVAVLVNVCLSFSNLSYVKLMYLFRKWEKEQQELQEQQSEG